VWIDHHHANSFRTTPLLCADLIFGKDRGGGDTANAKIMAADLVQSAPDAIVVAGDPALTQLHKLASTIPIVFTQVSEPASVAVIATTAPSQTVFITRFPTSLAKKHSLSAG
jgi:ABC-type uncharacterized transport system substrate-binding protein